MPKFYRVGNPKCVFDEDIEIDEYIIDVRGENPRTAKFTGTTDDVIEYIIFNVRIGESVSVVNHGKEIYFREFS